MFSNLASQYRRFAGIALFALVFGVPDVLAGTSPMVPPTMAASDASEHSAPVLPYRGMYYTPGRGGTGLTLDVDARGFVFAVFYTYDKNGNPYYYLIQGQYRANSPQVVVDTGVMGSVDAQAYISENGECVGDGCTYRKPDARDAHLSAHLVWSTPRRLHLTLGGQSWDIQGEQYTVSDVDLLTGTWATVATTKVGGIYFSMPQPLARLAPSEKSASDFPSLHLASNAVVFDARILSATGTPEPSTMRSYVGYDPNTGIITSFATAGANGSPTVTGTAFITGPQTVREYLTDHGQVTGEAVRFRLRSASNPL